MKTNNREQTVSESVLINVFDMLVKRLDEMQDSISKMNTYIINEARNKTNDVIEGSIFNYPFEVHNHNFFKTMFAYVYIKLNNEKTDVSLYDIFWSLWEKDPHMMSDNQQNIRNNIVKFMQETLGIEKYNEIKKGLDCYVSESDSEEDTEKFLCCSHYGIDTLYDYLPEYVLNEYIIKNETVKNFKSFNHTGYCISIRYASEYNNLLYVDQLIDDILVKLKKYGYKPNDIEYIKVVGLDTHMNNLLSFYDMNVPCSEVEKQRQKVENYINKLCNCSRERLIDTILECVTSKNLDLPIFNCIEDFEFIMDILRSDHE